MERIARGVQRELGRFGPAAGLAELVTAWPDAVGPDVARNAWPARIGRDGTLHVATSSSAWAFELGQLSSSVLERLRERLGESTPAALRFAVGKLPESVQPASAEPNRAVREPTSEERKRADEIAASIADEDLRKVVANAVASGLAKGPDGRLV
jgi:hypothetical protein